MFKSIQYRLYFYTGVLVVAIAGASWAFFSIHNYIVATLGIFALLICLSGLNDCYRRYHSNIIFLLNALDNGDYSFHFSETKPSMREKEINQLLNRIKDILARTRNEIIENETFLSLILEKASTGIVIVDSRGIVHKVNQAALKMLGLPVFTHLNQLQTIREDYPKLFQNLKAGDRMQLTLATEREEQQLSLHASQVTLKRGTMCILTLNNIGNELEMKEMESWIRLIRVMTHEIMNSIAPITSLSDTMRTLYRQEIDNKQATNTLEAFETIHATSAGLLTFVESYRKFTSIPTPKKETLRLRPLAERVAKLYKTEFQKKNISFATSIPESLSIRADENQIAQVLTNLLKNALEAIETTENERITISAKQIEPNLIAVEVANTGRPISPDVLPQIFIPFFTTKSGGSGVGLSVSRYIMRLHGGKLHPPVYKHGMTTFQLIFPL
jgi:nitrogen fixation/metabolism regulation signal transduction histidine kinase